MKRSAAFLLVVGALVLAFGAKPWKSPVDACGQDLPIPHAGPRLRRPEPVKTPHRLWCQARGPARLLVRVRRRSPASRQPCGRPAADL